MKGLSDRFGEAARGCRDLRQLGFMLRDVTLELGFDHFALLDHASLGSSSTALIRLDNYPASWVRELVDRGFALDDPVHLASRRTNAGFGWSEVGAMVELDRRHRHIFSRSRDHGLANGFTIPCNVPGEPSASCSFAVGAGRDLPLARLGCAELVGVHALRAARRFRPAVPRRARPRLSRREVQCLRLVALGKTDWEIAKILGLSPHTARQYVKRARGAYDAASRVQLLAFALRDEWISLGEAIPPSG